MFDIQYLIKEWLDKHAILYPRINVLKQGTKIGTVSVYLKWDRLVTYWLALVDIQNYKNEKKNIFVKVTYLPFTSVIRAPLVKPAGSYTNHLVCLSIRLSVRPSWFRVRSKNSDTFF